METVISPLVCCSLPSGSTLACFDLRHDLADDVISTDAVNCDEALYVDDYLILCDPLVVADDHLSQTTDLELPDSNERADNPQTNLGLEDSHLAEKPTAYFDDFVEDLNDPECVQRIYDFSLKQVRGMVSYNDEDDVIQEVFYRLTKWPIGKKYNSAAHYFSLLKITIRQAIAAYWKRQRSQRNDTRRRVFISQLEKDSTRGYEFEDRADNVLSRLHVKELVKDVLEQVKTLDEDQRMMFELRFVQERSHEEIAKALKVSIRTSYRFETRLRKWLQNRFYSQGS